MGFFTNIIRAEFGNARPRKTGGFLAGFLIE